MKGQWFKKVCATGFGIIMMFAFVACMPTGNGDIGTDYEAHLIEDYEVSGKLTIGITSDPREKAILEDGAVKTFQEMYPNVEIEYEDMGSNNYNSTILSYYNSNTLPDIVFSTSADAMPFIEDGIFLNLSNYIELEEERMPGYTDQFVDQMWKLGQKNYDGDQYLIPRSADKVVTHYNKAIFEAAGVDMSTVVNGWTWDDFLAACAKIRAYYDSMGWGVDGSDPRYIVDAYLNWEAVYYPMLVANGGEVFDENGDIAINSPETEKMLQMMSDLIDLGYVAPLNNTTQANFEGGKGAMMFHSTSPSRFVEIEGLKDSYDLVTFPLIGDNPKIGSGVPGYVISSTSQNKDLAWLFLSFLISADGQEALAKGGSKVPPIRKDMADPDTNAWGEGFEQYNMEAYVYGEEYTQITDFYIEKGAAYQSMLIEAVGDMVTAVTSRPDKTDLKTAMKNCEEDIVDALASVTTNSCESSLNAKSIILGAAIIGVVAVVVLIKRKPSHN